MKKLRCTTRKIAIFRCFLQYRDFFNSVFMKYIQNRTFFYQNLSTTDLKNPDLFEKS